MEQSSLVCDFLGVQQAAQNIAPTDGLAHSQTHANVGRNRPPLLRRISQSDSHMDVPHLLQASDKTFNNSLHHVLSGLFESTSTLNKPFGTSTETLQKPAGAMDSNFELQSPKSTLDRNKSALELTSAASSNSLCGEGESAANPPLRKVSSTLGNFASADQYHQHHHHQGSPQHPPSALSHFSSHFWGGSPHHHDSITKIPEEDQGLMMSIRKPAASASAASSLAATSAKNAILDSAANSSSSTTSASSGTSAASTSPPRNPLGGVMGVFGRGFFAKPVMRSESENYRYIMALDR